MNMEIIIAFGVYFTILGTIGFFAYRQSRKTSDFILGSRSLNYWVTALAAHASDMSGWLFMAFPAAIYSRGLIEAWTAVGLVLFMYLNWKFVAPKLRTLTERFHSLTLSSFFEQRFRDNSGMLRIVSALFCLYFLPFIFLPTLLLLDICLKQYLV
jgi:Na+/proline symporter